IAATNRDLSCAVAQGRLREDLYYRINVFDISIPPLRDRGNDILLLAYSALEEFAKTNGRSPMQFTSRAEGALLAYRWPGNVRQLRNAVERAAIVCEATSIDAEHLSLSVDDEAPPPPATDLAVLERHAIEQALRDLGGNKARAARQLGLSRTQLYVRL